MTVASFCKTASKPWRSSRLRVVVACETVFKPLNSLPITGIIELVISDFTETKECLQGTCGTALIRQTHYKWLQQPYVIFWQIVCKSFT